MHSASLRQLFVGVLLLCALKSHAWAGGGPLTADITYQGRLTSNGAPVNGTADLVFRLFDAEVGGVQHGPTLVFDDYPVNDGLFTVVLNFSAAVLADNVRWLQIGVNGSNLSPRQLVTAAPVALNLFGVHRGAADFLALGTGTATSSQFTVGTSIGAAAIHAFNDNSAPLTRYGVLGEGSASTAYGVFGRHENTSGTAAGVCGETLSTASNASGVHGVVASTTPGSFSAGVLGENHGASSFGIGVYGSHDGGGWGVYGETNGLLGRGVYGHSNVSTGFGGYFSSAGVALLADGADNNGNIAAVEIVAGSQTMLLDGNEIDTNAGLFLNNNVSQNVTIASGGGDVILGQSATQAGFVVLDSAMPRVTIGNDVITMTIDDTGVDLADDLSVSASSFSPLTLNRDGNDGNLITFHKDGSTVGSVSVSGQIVSYNAFTGSHYAWSDQIIARGALVSMTGRNRRQHESPNSEIVYGIAPVATANAPDCLGAYVGLQEPSDAPGLENPHLVASVGNGEMWVIDSGSNIAPGDPLISSDATGCAMKDDPARFEVGHIVARAAEPVDWTGIPTGDDGMRRALISVLFDASTRQGEGQSMAPTIEALQRENASLRATATKQQAMIDQLADRIRALEQSTSKRLN